MKITLDQFYLKTNKLDKIMIFLVFFFPLLLSISIFLADLFASIIAVTVIFLFLSKKNKHIFYPLKKSIYFFSIFYFLILCSLFFSISFKISALPSISYVRYFLFIMSIFYLLEKYDFMKKIIFYSLILTFSIVLFDSIYQFIFLENILSYPAMNDGLIVVTSFFNDEKKLGSYLIRLLPFLLSLLFFLKKDKLGYSLLIFTGFVIFLASERTALFLFIIMLIFYFLISKQKIKFFLVGSIFFLIALTTSYNHQFKYVTYTLQQLGFISTPWNQDYNGKLRYYSKQHENLAFTAIQIFKKNVLNGTGIKTFHKACSDLKSTIPNGTILNNRNNKLACSTHPHNYYFQILSDSGMFTFLFVFMFFLFILKKNIKLIFKKNINNIELSFYFVNIGILLNLFPFIPSGNFYNNWLSLIMFYPLGFWLYLNQKIKDVEKT